MKTTVSVLIILLLLGAAAPAQNSTDVLGRILSEAGFNRADLGYRPAGYWNRFPLDIPHQLTSFEALFAEPLKLYDYAAVMANTVEFYLDPAYADSTADGLYKLVYNLGVDKRLEGLRSYSANLLPAPVGDQPLVTAIDGIFVLAGRATEFYTFGNKSDWPDYRREISERTADLPDSVRLTLAELLVNLTEAIRWRQMAFRNCDRLDMETAFNIRDLADTQADGMFYYPELDDIAATIDLPSLHYAALKTAAAAEKAEKKLARFAGEIPEGFELELRTPFGKVAVFSPTFDSDKSAAAESPTRDSKDT